ncbi:MAG: carbohydrate ABC transporter permease [Chloroflexota bacterium]|nr:carbohydrate ABC transporter permease [Chloroflexota bacterium]
MSARMNRRSMTQRVLHGRWHHSLLLHTVVMVAVVIAIVPVFWTVSTSLKPLHEVYAYPPKWIPSQFMWQNYVTAWNDAPFDRYAFNSLFVTTIILVSQLILGSLAAYVFARLQFPGRDLIFLAFLATMMVPTQVLIVPTFVIFKHLGWIDTYMALTVPFLVNAFGVFLIRQSYLSVPEDLVDAARIDGAGHLRIIWNVLVPVSKPAYVSFALLTFTWRWNDYFWPLIMTNSTEMRTLPVGLVFLRTTEGSIEWNVVMAAAVFVIAPIIVLFLIFQRYFVQGVIASGVKM